MERSSRADLTPATFHGPSRTRWVPLNVTRPSPATQRLYRTALFHAFPFSHASATLLPLLPFSLSSFPRYPHLPLRFVAVFSRMGASRDSTPPVNHPRSMPVREDCWSEEATSTLVNAWGRRYIQVNRGNLRLKDWQDVADAVNALHGHTKKTLRTDVQCKNRIDTIKKKYKVEKNRVSSPNGAPSTWPFFDRLDVLFGPSLSAKKALPSPSVVLSLPYHKTPSPASTVPPKAWALPQKRPAKALLEDGFFMRNYSAAAAAAGADEDEEEEEEEEDEDEDEERASEVEQEEREKEGMRSLAKAIVRFGEVYERTEKEKLRQMVELEKQRMQFDKDLEGQRMHMFMDTQVQLGRIKRGKRSGSNDMYS